MINFSVLLTQTNVKVTFTKFSRFPGPTIHSDVVATYMVSQGISSWHLSKPFAPT